MIDVTIIIVNWNTCDLLADCLDSVYEQTDRSQIKVIVIDNGSANDSVTMVKRDFPEVIVIENNENRGFDAGLVLDLWTNRVNPN